jgi:ribosomal protein S27E
MTTHVSDQGVQEPDRHWPTPGFPSYFRCDNCKKPLLVIYEPETHTTCAGCGADIHLPPLPPGYFESLAS